VERLKSVDGGDGADDVERFCAQLHPRLLRSLALQCGDLHVAEELAQETLARVWLHWSKVRGMDAPEAWAFRVAVNLATSRWRRVAAERRATATLRSRATEDASNGDAADALAVREAVAALPSRQRLALVLRYYADLSVADAADALRCRPGTVKALTSQAIAGLRARLAVDLIEEDDVHV
jgi:RNA polymerase sigma-70 factor (sigma-E family)